VRDRGASVLVGARAKAALIAGFVHDWRSDARRFRILSIADDVTWDRQARAFDTSISARDSPAD
jgi:hypothetical protein